METFNFENYLSKISSFTTKELENKKEELEYKISNFIYEPYLCEKIAAVTQELGSRYDK